jgi:hypothetical protein
MLCQARQSPATLGEWKSFRILVIVVIPPDVSDWLEHDETRLSLKRCGYWISLHGRPERPNTTSVNINIPRGQAFTVQALDEMFRRLAEGERL